jgi:nucleotidyltransferase substrate binding protein (TIGR01987 family)
LAWKAVALLAREEGLDAYSPREALRIALRLGWVEDDELWLGMLDARNRTSHTDNEATAEAIYQQLTAYSAAMHQLHARLWRNLDGPNLARPGRQDRGTTSA